MHGNSAGETGFDQVLAFTVPDSDARGRAVRLGPVLDVILSAHDYPPAIKHLLAECLVLTALLGSFLKDNQGQLTVQAQAEGGIVDLLVCDYRQGEIRGYARHEESRIDEIGSSSSLETVFGSGYLAITFDQAGGEDRYQGIVPLEGASLSEACEAYFQKSEQIPTLVRLGVRTAETGCVAGGLLVQHLPVGEQGGERLHVTADEQEHQWEHVAILAGSTRHDELVDAQLSLEQLVWRLFHEESEIRVEKRAGLTRGCRCTAEHFQQVLSRFPESERAEMRDDDGSIPVDCAFCSKIIRISV